MFSSHLAAVVALANIVIDKKLPPQYIAKVERDAKKKNFFSHLGLPSCNFKA
jgi:hypothetical protein